MFVQVISGHVTDPGEAKAVLENWLAGPGKDAVGWLGTTAGVADDGRLFVIASFESEELARQNSDRPEQGQWWATAARVFDDEPQFFDSKLVWTDMTAGLPAATFVQLIRGRAKDAAAALRVTELSTDSSSQWAQFRPDVLGNLLAIHEDGVSWTMAVYFTSEAEAREREQQELPPELQAEMEQMAQLSDGPQEYVDLHEPWFFAPQH